MRACVRACTLSPLSLSLAQNEERPSLYSKEVKLPRYVKTGGGKDARDVHARAKRRDRTPYEAWAANTFMAYWLPCWLQRLSAAIVGADRY